MLFTVKYKENDIWKYVLDDLGRVAFLDRNEIKSYNDINVYCVSKIL